ncbi:helix-turn-helix transcriptional regulator [Paremcibacter congregatus]|uniref:Transcription factor LuxR-like autoinducer-binding domain-containing protein n=1 Tax=Paremcibacter congregatus TaxID=2043170 RepID=A0A2G4YWE7_9PROT|nr:autoinducer binding domain-containing protein [Paremcibacter congregatus]PHZ86658.1 hypothetical protein CRD36_01930 [Paremcibacter congregatus]QDE26459.1 hypothetical protein FIV45_03805 [Paremcibacter congregatus]|tara:strand:- start:13744 stop:14466 length:723 start_codon:yes stop_codon:yes gene_type:complete
MDHYSFLIESTEKLKQCHNDWELKDTFQRIIEELGFFQFIYMVYTLKNMKFVHAIYTFDSEWREKYNANRFEEIDPVFVKSFTSRDAFFWSSDDYKNIPEIREKFFDVANEHFHYHGITTPYQLNHDHRALVTVSAGQKTPEEKEVLSSQKYLTLVSALSSCFLQVALTHKFFGKSALTLKPFAKRILRLSEMGLTTKQISLILDKSPNYIDEIFKGLFCATGIRSRTALISFMKFKKII